MIADDVFENSPNVGSGAFDLFFGSLDGEAGILSEFFHDERFEEFESHFLREAALVEFEFGPDDDDGAAGIVDAFAEEVLPEATLFAFKHIGERFERTIAGTSDGPSAPSVIDKGVEGLLKHAFFIANDDVGSFEMKQTIEAVIAIDDASV